MPRPNCKLRDVSAFVAAGNFFEGDATGASLKSRIEWEGSGNTLILGADGKQRDVVFQLCGKAKIEIGPRCEITGTFRADARSRIAMGSDCRVNRPSVIRSCEGGLVQIGNGCLFANVMIRNSDLHAVIDMAANTRVNAGADIILDDRVWLAEDVYVYKGVTIGKNTVVAARSTVLKSLPEHCVAAGTPARVVKTGTTWNRSLNPSKWT